ncbi:hypothetical protein NLI96_g644 [Meripilus lineatus]|uniref:F-box domain-containing protein n=1 Tax=Meripilus lineatus TaxID=2056292 RepID=A0AAD5VBZ1_9APHY|nr:hypothetical protein NLI96_g644 [Physisporinus lineatus]
MTASSPTLPSEVISLVIQHLQTTRDEGAPILFDMETYHAQHQLRAVSLVCRAWSIVVTSPLYSHPTLISQRSVRLLRRTLESSARLALVVRGITLYHEPELKLPYIALGNPLNDWNAGLIAFSRTCSSLKTLSINIRHSYDYMYAPVEHRMTFHVQHIVVRRTTLLALLRLFKFPLLEKLSLYSNPFNVPTRKCHSLPKVHNLLFYRCLSPHDNLREMANWRRILPSLRSIEILGTSRPPQSPIVPGHQGLPYFEGLETLCFVEIPIILNFGSWESCRKYATVRHLVFGVVSHADHFLAHWDLPPSLETLTFFVTVKPSPRSNSDTDTDRACSWRFIAQCLERNRGHLRVSLQRLTVNTAEPLDRLMTPWDEVVPLELRRIQSFCSAWGTRLELNDLGNATKIGIFFRTSDVSVDARKWMMERLLSGPE